MLQEKTDQDLDRDDYVELVDRIQMKFLGGVQKNIRLRMLLEFGSNWRVLTSRRSSMTDRLARLYDRELFALVEDELRENAAPAFRYPHSPKGRSRNLIPNIKIGSAVTKRRS